jgi:hypothetical protein
MDTFRKTHDRPAIKLRMIPLAHRLEVRRALIPNTLHRQRLGSRDKLAINADGSIDL